MLRFAPRWHWVLLTLLALPLFVSLGVWQWQRGQARQAQWNEFASSDTPARDVPASALTTQPRYTRVSVHGSFDGTRQFLLDNMSHRGAPGYHVLTVMQLADGSRLLVNRGWLPFSGYREQLPDVALDPAARGDLTLTGRIGALPVAGLRSGQAAPASEGGWPRVTSFPTLEQLEAAYGATLLPVVLLLDPGTGPGYLRDWQPAGLPPQRHIGYAVQWWSFAVLLVGLFIGLNLKRSHA
jgi:surfeit locus 1 family protein